MIYLPPNYILMMILDLRAHLAPPQDILNEETKHLDWKQFEVGHKNITKGMLNILFFSENSYL